MAKTLNYLLIYSQMGVVKSAKGRVHLAGPEPPQYNLNNSRLSRMRRWLIGFIIPGVNEV
jgi:hypothetical protein